MGERLLHADVGPVRPADYAQNMRRPRLEAVAVAAGGAAVAGNLPAGEDERVLRQIERNSQSSHGRDRGPTTLHADSCCGGTSDMGPIV
jgi:hypothetical protein